MYVYQAVHDAVSGGDGEELSATEQSRHITHGIRQLIGLQTLPVHRFKRAFMMMLIIMMKLISMMMFT
jgi:hypothetical protein